MSTRYIDLVLTKAGNINLLHRAPGFSDIKPGFSFISENGERYLADSVFTTELSRVEARFVLEATGYESINNVPKVMCFSKNVDVEVDWSDDKEEDEE